MAYFQKDERRLFADQGLSKRKIKPKFWRCLGGSLPYKYGFGYWTGEQGDLLCVKPHIRTNEEATKHKDRSVVHQLG